MPLLHDIFTDIRRYKDISGISISDLYVCSPFTVVKLSEGSIGSAGNYDVQNHTAKYDAERIRTEYIKLAERDPLLTKILATPKTFTELSVKVAVLSALSQSLLNAGALSAAGLSCRSYRDPKPHLEKLLEQGDRVAMVGFGGAFEEFCASEKVRNLTICDYMFESRKYRKIASDRIKKTVGNSSKISLAHDLMNLPKTFDVCYITGSAFCNGTMDRLLRWASQCREIIIQGPSCSLFPVGLFFRHRISLLLTNRKSRAEFNYSRQATDKIYEIVDTRKIRISGLSEGTAI